MLFLIQAYLLRLCILTKYIVSTSLFIYRWLIVLVVLVHIHQYLHNNMSGLPSCINQQDQELINLTITRLNEKEEEIRLWKSKAKETEAEVTKLKDQVDSLEDENTDLKDQLEMTKDKLKVTTNNNKRVEDMLRKTIEELTMGNEGLKKEIGNLKTQVSLKDVELENAADRDSSAVKGEM